MLATIPQKLLLHDNQIRKIKLLIIVTICKAFTIIVTAIATRRIDISNIFITNIWHIIFITIRIGAGIIIQVYTWIMIFD